MRICLAAAAVALALLAAGCGREAGPDTTAAPAPVSPSAPSEDALQRRAGEAYGALEAEEWVAYYEYQSPRLRRRRWPYGLELSQPCSPQKFALEMDSQMARLRSSLGVDEDEPLTLRVSGVTLDNIDGVVYVDVLYEGELIVSGVEAAGEAWIYLDGEWWREDAELGRCPMLGFGGLDGPAEADGTTEEG